MLRGEGFWRPHTPQKRQAQPVGRQRRREGPPPSEERERPPPNPTLHGTEFWSAGPPPPPPPLEEREREGKPTSPWPARQAQNPTTSFLTATTLIYAIGAGITAAAGTRLALQLFLVKGFKLYSFQLQDLVGPVLLFLVTTSPCRDWVICAPAAFLRCGSRFSGSLSGIEPWFSVTRYNHGRRITYHRVDKADIWKSRRQYKTVRSAQNCLDSPENGAEAPIGFDLTRTLLTRRVGASFSCISSRFSRVIQVGNRRSKKP